MKGCVPQFEKWLQDNLTLVAGIFIGVALLQVRVCLCSGVGVAHGVSGPSSSHAASSALALQIFGICLAQNLVSDIEAVQASW